MSFDPYASGSEPPEPDDRFTAPEDRFPARTPGRSDQIKSRVQGPAISLIVLGILNVLWALYMLANGILYTVAPDFAFKAQKQWSEAFPQKQATTPDQLQMQGVIISYPLAILAFAASVLPIAGGIRMLSLKSYTLSVCGAISAMVPCISCLACCGVGEGIGIWALIVLLNPDVKSAFQ